MNSIDNKKKNSFLSFVKGQKGYLYLLPVIVFMLLFTFYPFFDTLFIAFKNNYDYITGNSSGFGVDNFVRVIKSASFSNYLTNTLVYAFVSVPISTVLALFISIWLTKIKKLQKLYQTLFFLPYLTNALAIGAVFQAAFSIVQGSGTTVESYGIINTIIGWFGIKPINFLNPGSTKFWNYVVVILFQIWSGLPFKILILFSALQGVSKQYYDAAKIDGANKVTTLAKITVPLISPMISYLLITGFIGGFKEYTSVLGIFQQTMGPINDPHRMDTIVGYIYYQLNTGGNLGLAAAMAVILLVIILIFTAINFYISKKKVHY